MGRRIIFLDVDGVLNNVAWREQQEYMSPPGTPREHRGIQWIDPSAVERLNDLVEQSGAELVLSSSWRVRGIDRIQEMLELRGFRGRLIDRTPLADEHDPAVFRRLAGKDPPSGYMWPRGYEIQQWLDDQFDIESIVILDDAGSMEHLMPWLVRTSMSEGLCDHHVAQALILLGRPGPQPLVAPSTSNLYRSEGAVWELRASELINLVTSKLSRTQSDRPLFGTDTTAWPATRWHNYFAALDRWWRWAQLGRSAETETNYAEASACLAAALWLQPESADSVFSRTLRQRHDVSKALRRAFDPEFPGLAFRARHERAWALGRSLAGLPTLLRWSCDPRPWVRVQIYRSLARLAHPAGIQVLQEGSFDPNPRARAAAVYGLGRCLDPTAFGRLRTLARGEKDPQVRATANEALQLIATYWAHFGEWGQLLESPPLLLDLVRELDQRRGRPVALALLDHCLPEDPRAKRLRATLDDGLGQTRPSRNYEPPPRLAPDDDGAGYPDPVQAHADLRASGARGFEARRAFRFLGIGMTATRRAHAPAQVD